MRLTTQEEQLKILRTRVERREDQLRMLNDRIDTAIGKLEPARLLLQGEAKHKAAHQEQLETLERRMLAQEMAHDEVREGLSRIQRGGGAVGQEPGCQSPLEGGSGGIGAGAHVAALPGTPTSLVAAVELCHERLGHCETRLAVLGDEVHAKLSDPDMASVGEVVRYLKEIAPRVVEHERVIHEFRAQLGLPCDPSTHGSSVAEEDHHALDSTPPRSEAEVEAMECFSTPSAVVEDACKTG